MEAEIKSIGRLEKEYDVTFNGFQFWNGECYLTLTDNETKSTFLVSNLLIIRETQEKIRKTFRR